MYFLEWETPIHFSIVNRYLKTLFFRTIDSFVPKPSEIKKKKENKKNEGWGATLGRRFKNLVSELRYAQDCIQLGAC